AGPRSVKRAADVALNATAAGGLKSITVYLGNRQVCSITATPYKCTVKATGADVGNQMLRAVITDQLGSTAAVQRPVRVAKFNSKLTLDISRKNVKGGVERTIEGKLTFPSAVTKAQGCSGSVQLTVKRAGHSVLNQEVKVSKSCTFERSITAARSGQSFEASAKFGGNAALATAKATRRFS